VQELGARSAYQVGVSIWAFAPTASTRSASEPGTDREVRGAAPHTCAAAAAVESATKVDSQAQPQGR